MMSSSSGSTRTWRPKRSKPVVCDLFGSHLFTAADAEKPRQQLEQLYLPEHEHGDSNSPITCMVFGQERFRRDYVLLAVGSKDGAVVVYRCYRTEEEIQLLTDQAFFQDDGASFNASPADGSKLMVHSRLEGHCKAITSICFNLLEDRLVTTSTDKTLRMWNVDSGEMLKVFTSNAPVCVAKFLPFSQHFVAALRSRFRLVSGENGTELQSMKMEAPVREMSFDDTGRILFAGMQDGGIHVLEASDSKTSFEPKSKIQLRGCVSCITFVPAAYGEPSCLLVNTSDSSVDIIDCTYGPLSTPDLTIRHRVKVASSRLLLKNCHSPSGHGYLISGSEDAKIHICSLGRGCNYEMQYLEHHEVPVIAVAVNFQDTLLASADALGRIVLWRRMYSCI